MIFPILKYIKPIWYFNLNTIKNDCWIDYESLKNKELIEFDKNYSDYKVSLLDAAYQAKLKGYIPNQNSKFIIPTKIVTTEYDNFRFINKFFSKKMSFYALFLKIILFDNVIESCMAFFKSIDVKKLNILHKINDNSHFERFKCNLIEKNVGVSVIIPTLNRYEYLKDVLKDLEKQNHKNFEVIIIDQSDNFDRNFYEKFKLNKKIIYQTEKALWLARNRAVTESKHDLILLFDDDSRVDCDWISNHLKCIEYFNCHISSGISLSLNDTTIPNNYRIFKISDQIDTGNVLIKKDVFKKTGLFDRQFEKQRMGDGEFGLRAYKLGFVNISNPYSKRLHLKAGLGGLRDMGSWDAFRPKSFFSARPIPSVLYYFRKYYGEKLSVFSLIRNIPQSVIPYKLKHSKLKFFGYLIVVLILPIIITQVLISWRLASIKLNEGDKIKRFE